MKTLDIREATSSLADYLEQLSDEPIIVIRGGRPIAALTTLEKLDWETISLSTSPEFLSIIEQSQKRHAAEGGIGADEMRRRLGLTG